ncbi:MAG: hypothetical protein QME68_01750 [Elusimicrobiota bacterium]|nr:hypothetical protein [Elusimicrobiota bacterium]
MKEMIVLVGYIVSVFGGGIFVSLSCRMVKFSLAKDSGIKRAGLIIGILEQRNFNISFASQRGLGRTGSPQGVTANEVSARGGRATYGKLPSKARHILERFIILTFVLFNQYSAIAFIFTAKSIARFEELKNRDFAEYYLVGTLSSVAFAIFCGEIMKFLLRKI